MTGQGGNGIFETIAQPDGMTDRADRSRPAGKRRATRDRDTTTGHVAANLACRTSD